MSNSRRGSQITGLSPEGRTTIIVLAMNFPQQLAIRAALVAEGIMAQRE
jgi:hypothetical protein